MGATRLISCWLSSWDAPSRVHSARGKLCSTPQLFLNNWWMLVLINMSRDRLRDVIIMLLSNSQNTNEWSELIWVSLVKFVFNVCLMSICSSYSCGNLCVRNVGFAPTIRFVVARSTHINFCIFIWYIACYGSLVRQSNNLCPLLKNIHFCGNQTIYINDPTASKNIWSADSTTQRFRNHVLVYFYEVGQTWGGARSWLPDLEKHIRARLASPQNLPAACVKEGWAGERPDFRKFEIAQHKNKQQHVAGAAGLIKSSGRNWIQWMEKRMENGTQLTQWRKNIRHHAFRPLA